MSKEEILNELISLLKELCPTLDVDFSKITMNSKLKDDFNLDSLSLLLMSIGIEKRFNIVLTGLDFETINDVSNIVNYIYERLK